jgi:hypothetical protein
MPEWLTGVPSRDPNVSLVILSWRIGMALVLGIAVAGIYRWARRGEVTPVTFVPTLILLATLIAMATQIIGDNIARAFSLVGALSVVRFRTVVKDTQDTAFVIFAVVVGMASGANHLAVGVIGLCILVVASVVLWPPVRRGAWEVVGGTLSVRIGLAAGLQGLVEETLASSSHRYQLVSISTARQGSCLDLDYRIWLRPGINPSSVVTDLNLINGTENVDLKQTD